MKTIPKTIMLALAGAIALGMVSTAAYAEDDDTGEGINCKGLPTHGDLRAALTAARKLSNGGFNLDMWGTL